MVMMIMVKTDLCCSTCSRSNEKVKGNIDHGDSSMTEANDGKGGQKTKEGDVHPASAGLGLRLRLLFGHEEDVADKRIIPTSFLSHQVGFEDT